MGLSSSQARLLHLTARMHQIEYKAAKVEAMKLQMANESRRVYEEYLDAIDASKIQYKVLNTDASVTHTDANYNALCFGQAGDRYALFSPYTDEVFVTSDIQAAFENFPSSPSGFATSLTGYTPPTAPTVSSPTVAYNPPETPPQTNNSDINLVRIDSSQNGASETIKAGNTINMTLNNLIQGSGSYGYTITTLDSTKDADISVQYLDNGRLVISGNNLSITANGGQNDDIILLGSNNKVVTADGNDIIRVAQARDSEGIYSGMSQNNIIDSGSGNDHVTFYYKNNKLIDGDGVNVLYANTTVADNTNTSSASVSSSVNVSSNSAINSQTPDTIEGCAAQTNANDCRLFSLINSLGGNNNNGNLSSYVTITETTGGYNVKFNNYNGTGINNVDITTSEIANYNGVSGDLTTALIDYALNQLMYTNKDDSVLRSGATNSTNAFSRADYQTVSKYFFGNTNFGMYNADWGDDVRNNLINIWKDYSAHTNNVTNISLTFASDNAALGIYSGHAYSVKNLVLNSDNSIKYAEVINPWDDADVVRLDGNTLNRYIGSVYTFGSPAYNRGGIVHNANSSLTTDSSDYVVSVNSTAAEDEWYYYYNLHQAIAAHGMILISEDNAKSSTWLTNAVNGGFAYLKVLDTKADVFVDTSVAVNTSLQEIQDETLLRKAEAKYEADMKRIDLKDRKYDTDLAAIETERNAIKQEMETLKTVSKDNVERTFKLFS